MELLESPCDEDSSDSRVWYATDNKMMLYADDSSSSDNTMANYKSSTIRSRINSVSRDLNESQVISKLKPIGVYWDIENIQIPSGKSALVICQIIRETYFGGHFEADFVIVCDVTKESPLIIKELNDAQVNIIHVPATCKNAADEKLRHCMRRFVDIHGYPSTIILISSDVNFSPDLSDFRHCKNIHTILLYNSPVPESLLLFAHEHYNFRKLLEDKSFTYRAIQNPENENNQLFIFNLPTNVKVYRIVKRLHQISSNCGGKVICTGPGYAVLKFANMQFTSRANKRLEGEDVFGKKILVTYACRNYKAMRHRIYQKNKYKRTDEVKGVDVKSNSYNGKSGGLSSFPTRSHSRKMRDTNFADDSSSGYFSELCVNSDRYLEPKRLCPTVWESTYTKSHSDVPVPKLLDARPAIGYACNPCESASLMGSSYTSKVLKYSEENEFDSCNGSERSLVPLYSANKTPPITKINAPVELLVSNLDQSLEAKDLRRSLCNLFQQYIKVLYLNVAEQSDGNLMAIVKAQSMSDAQYAISQLHRKKIGSRRITISYAKSRSSHFNHLSNEVHALLKEIPDKSLPLFKFRELFEKRYHHPVSLSELYKMKDISIENVDGRGRMVTLDHDQLSYTATVESPHCTLHTNLRNDGKGWAERDFNMVLPNINIRLSLLRSRLNFLLDSHGGVLVLASVPDCYDSQFHDLVIDDEKGVSMEHLISSLSEFKITLSATGFKKVERCMPGDTPPASNVVSPYLQTPVNLFCREIVDLLKASTPRSQILFTKFIPAYHNHFGRQCRVADYGYTKLIDLLNAMPDVIQILGEGTKRTVTLSHKTQVRRFVGDVLRVLKAQSNKKLFLSEFPILFEKTCGRKFNVVSYGACHIEDLIEDIPESAFTVKYIGDDIVIFTDKREQTADELARMYVFRKEVEELLRHAPCYQMNFNKFIPCYHHHFGRQCKISDYGFVKLLELFEAIPDVVEIVDDDDVDEKVIQLTLERRKTIFVEQVETLLKKAGKYLSVDELSMEFVNQFGFCIHLELYGALTLEDLLYQIDSLELVNRRYDLFVGLKSADWNNVLKDNSECHSGDGLETNDDNGDDEDDECEVGRDFKKGTINTALPYSTLSNLLSFIEKSKFVLHTNRGSVPLLHFEELYQCRFGYEIPDDYFGFGCLENLFYSLPCLYTIIGKGSSRQVCFSTRSFIFLGLDQSHCPECSLFQRCPPNLPTVDLIGSESRSICNGSSWFSSTRDLSRLAANFEAVQL